MLSEGGVFFVKGHGTGNDFVVLPDPDGTLELTPELVRRMCDRHLGIGADGVLRVVRSTVEFPARLLDSVAPPEWFMDYRNADGSIAEMCGNGSRVFARFLLDAGWVEPEFSILTRAAVHAVRQEANDDITVEMGPVRQGPIGPVPSVSIGGRTWAGEPWWVPNPHVVVFVDDLDQPGQLLNAPAVEAGQRFPDGQNVEFVVDLTDGANPTELRAALRVFERGVGETLSCGTGVCAASLSLRQRRGVDGPGAVEVEVPGGRLTVLHGVDGRIELSGPVELVAHGVFMGDWVAGVERGSARRSDRNGDWVAGVERGSARRSDPTGELGRSDA